MKLLANGCSFTYGHQTPRDKNNQILPPMSIAWPAQLNDKFDDVTNLSLGGGSNDRIVRTTIDFCESNDMSDYIVIIQWTSQYRKEVYNKSINDYVGLTTYIDYPNQILNNVPKSSLTMICDLEVKNNDKFVDAATQEMLYLWSTTDYKIHLLKNILTLQNYFLKHNIKFYFTTMSPEEHVISNKFLDFYNPQKTQLESMLLQCVDKDKWSGISFAGFMDGDLDLIVSHDDHHPNEKGHKLLAQFLYEGAMKIYG